MGAGLRAAAALLAAQDLDAVIVAAVARTSPT